MKVGDLVRVKDNLSVNEPWRGQLALIVGPGELDVSDRFELKRLHDGFIGYAASYILEEAGDEGG